MHHHPGNAIQRRIRAINWLCNTLGFTRHLVVPDDDGGIAHAELTLGSGMIMLGSRRENSSNPDSAPTTTETWTQSVYIVVGDIHASYERAKAAEANIVAELEEQPYGGSLFSIHDLEGNLWNIGSYDPWVAQDSN